MHEVKITSIKYDQGMILLPNIHKYQGAPSSNASGKAEDFFIFYFLGKRRIR